ncbi:MAG: SdpI family protein [bacterium]
MQPKDHKYLRLFWILPVILVFIVAILAYFQLPETIPIHWGIEGTADRWGSKAEALFIIPGIMLAFLILLFYIPKIDPMKKHYASFADVYYLFGFMFLAYFALIYFAVIGQTLGYDFDFPKLIMVLMGLLLIFCGYIMPKIKQNWFFGIRLPWTLSSEKVWNKTHSFSKPWFIILGILTIILAFYDCVICLYVMIGGILLLILTLAIYSYLEYSKYQK